MSAPTITPVWLSGEEVAGEVLDATLARAWSCIDGTVAALSVLDPFEPIDLPDSVASGQQQERLQLIGPLYLAAQLEATRLVDAAETVAGLYVSAALPIAGTRAGEELVQFWRDRTLRFSPDEREALFARLFGTPAGITLTAGPSNRLFEGLMRDLCEILAGGGDLGGAGAVVAAELVDNVLDHTAGLPSLVARELMTTVTIAVNLFKLPEVRTAVGASTTWAAVGAVADRYLGGSIPVRSLVGRATAGLTIMSWLAEVAGGRDARRTAIPDSVRDGAWQWLHSSVQLAEERTGA